MKKKNSFWETLKKNKKKVSGLLVLCLCLGILTAIGGVFPSEKTSSSQEIPEHDGDVLVDSVKVEEETGTEVEKKESKKTNKKNVTVTSDDGEELRNSDTYFEEMRATITMDRNQVISMLTDTQTQSENTTEKENANKQKLKILSYMEMEQNVENMIKTKGLPQCLVMITDSGVSVTVDKQKLNQSDVAKICEVVMRETGKKASEIVIQSKF
ncbi:MAG: SpoIIIAH-like family protein [Anaerovoracaceae bacterium]